MRYPFPNEDFEVLTDNPATDNKTTRTVKLRPKRPPCTCKKCGSSEYTSDETNPRKTITLDESGCVTEIIIMDTKWRCKSCRSRLESNSIPDYLEKKEELVKYSDELLSAAVDALVTGYGSTKKVAETFEIKSEKILRKALDQRMTEVKREKLESLMPCGMLVIYPFQYAKIDGVKDEDGMCTAIWGICDMDKKEYGVDPYPVLYDILPDFSKESIAKFLDEFPFEDEVPPDIEFTSYSPTMLAFLKGRYPDSPVGVLRTFMLKSLSSMRDQMVLWTSNVCNPRKDAVYTEEPTASGTVSNLTSYQIRQEIRRKHQKRKEEIERVKYRLDMLCSRISSIEYGDNFEYIYKIWRDAASAEKLETMMDVLSSTDIAKKYCEYYGQYDYNMELSIPKYEWKNKPGKEETTDADKVITDYSDDVTTNYMEWQMRFIKNFKKAGVPFETMCYRVWSCVAAQNNEGIPPRLLLRSDYAGTGITGFRIDLNMLNELFADADLSE